MEVNDFITYHRLSIEYLGIVLVSIHKIYYVIIKQKNNHYLSMFIYTTIVGRH